MQHFIDGFITQCKRHNLRAELLMVEWNPPEGRKSLRDELVWPPDPSPCEVRIVTVSREMHAALPHSEHLPLYQMIAKNVGIVRARGQFVLATNIDILFSDEIIVFMRDHLEEGRLYRCERHDIPSNVPAFSDFGELLNWCRENTFRINANGRSVPVVHGGVPPTRIQLAMAVVTRLATKAQSNLRDEIRNISHSASHYSRNFRKHSRRAFSVLATTLGFHLSDDAALEFASDDFLGKLTRYYLALPLRFVRYIAMLPIRMLASGWRAIFRTIAYIESLKYFTNACGDFTLLSKADWERLRGYPEWPIFSFHIDSILLYQANRAGLTEVHLSRENAIYHIEHGPGSGFTPEHADKMFARLDARGIPYLDWTSDVQTILEDMNRMRDAHVPVVFNEADWGYRSIVLEDIPVCATEAVPA